MIRTAERMEFLTDLFITAIEHCGYGQFSIREMSRDGEPASEIYAVIVFHEEGEDGGTHRVTLDTMAHGLTVIRNAVMRELTGPYESGKVPHNRETGERLFFGGTARRELMLCDRTNGDDGDYDVIGALAVLECALFGKVVYG